jgi:hypothetical protein
MIHAGTLINKVDRPILPDLPEIGEAKNQVGKFDISLLWLIVKKANQNLADLLDSQILISSLKTSG